MHRQRLDPAVPAHQEAKLPQGSKSPGDPQSVLVAKPTHTSLSAAIQWDNLFNHEDMRKRARRNMLTSKAILAVSVGKDVFASCRSWS